MIAPLVSLVAFQKSAASRLVQFHDQLSEVVDPGDPRGWLLSGVAALGSSLSASLAAAFPSRSIPYMISDAAPRQDTFMGYALPPPPDRASALVEAVLSAYAARQAVRALDGELPEQPLATTLDRRGAARSEPNDLRHAAFLLDGQVRLADLGPEPAAPGLDGPALAARLAALVRALAAPSGSLLRRPSASSPVPFACICIDEELRAYLRHSARHAWVDSRGPWLGLGRAGELRAVATSHFAVDGYGHAWLTAAIAEASAGLGHRYREPLLAELLSLAAVPAPSASSASRTLRSTLRSTLSPPLLGPPPGRAPRVWPALGDGELPAPLGIATRTLPSPSPRITPLAYRFGQLLARALPATPGAPPPTVFIPIAPGDRSDPLRVRRRVSAVVVSVRPSDSDPARPEPYPQFAARAAAAFAAEASGQGIHGVLHRAAASLPLPLRWKRELIGNYRPRWLGALPAALGGRACLSSIRMSERRLPPLVAVSCPVLLPTALDPIGGCVVTILDDGHQATITASGAGLAGTDAAAAALLDELLAE